jgi:hypothetical protein
MKKRIAAEVRQSGRKSQSRRMAGWGIGVGLLLPCLGLASVINGGAYGNISGASYNHDAGQSTSCFFGSPLIVTSGGCGYTNTGSTNDGSGKADGFVASINSSVDAQGKLHAFASVAVTNEPVYLNQFTKEGSAAFTSTVYAYMSEIVTVTPPIGGSTNIKAVVNASVDGTPFILDKPEAFGYAILSLTNGYNTIDSVLDSTGATQTMQDFYTPDSNGQFTFGLNLQVEADVNCSSQQGGTHLCTATAREDYSSTGKINSILIEDLQGNILSGYTLTTASGVDYNATGPASSAPEPGTWILGAGSILAFVAMRRKAGTT